MAIWVILSVLTVSVVFGFALLLWDWVKEHNYKNRVETEELPNIGCDGGCPYKEREHGG